LEVKFVVADLVEIEAAPFFFFEQQLSVQVFAGGSGGLVRSASLHAD
jgi:hypothetical protein